MNRVLPKPGVTHAMNRDAAKGGRPRGEERPPRESEVCEVFRTDAAAAIAARKAMLDEEIVLKLAGTFKALGDPTRVRILHALSERELCVCDLATLLAMTPSAVSHQLSLLRHLRLVRPRKSGRVVYYSLDDDHVVDLFQRGLEHVRHGES